MKKNPGRKERRALQFAKSRKGTNRLVHSDIGSRRKMMGLTKPKKVEAE